MWKDLIKVDEDNKGERYKRFKQAQRNWRMGDKRRGATRKPDQPKYKCAMCGVGLSKYNKEHQKNKINYCKTCKKIREKR
tara:strand:+ start:7732 stop:7971 length:240 start_codon:yes stop_codon:yes gene_type:complete